MPNVISLKNGKPQTIFGMRDFLYLVDEHMGMDCRDYLRDYLTGISNGIKDALSDNSNTMGKADLIEIINRIENEVGR